MWDVPLEQHKQIRPQKVGMLSLKNLLAQAAQMLVLVQRSHKDLPGRAVTLLLASAEQIKSTLADQIKRALVEHPPALGGAASQTLEDQEKGEMYSIIFARANPFPRPQNSQKAH